MKRILLLSLLLLPIVALAQYPTFSNKQKLGVQTTGDGLIFRGTTINNIPNYTPSNVNNAYFHLDTVQNKLYLYNATAWQLVYPSPQFDTTTLNVYLKISDTTAMLLPYFRDSDTTSLNLINRFALKLNISDTATMLTPYLRKADTISLSNRINLKFNISDTTILSNRITTNANNIITINNKLVTKLDTIYIKFKNVVTRVVNKDTINIGSSLTDGYAINIIGDSVNVDTTLLDIRYPDRDSTNELQDITFATTSGIVTISGSKVMNLDTLYSSVIDSVNLLIRDSIAAFTPLTEGYGINIIGDSINVDTSIIFIQSDTITLSNRIDNKLSLIDTASMLLPYLKLADTTSMLAPYFRDSDTTMLNLTTRFNSKLNTTDTVSLSDRINLKLNPIDTISLSNRINIKLNPSDTVSLSNRINTKLDTIYVNYQTSIDTIVNKDTINITTLEAGAGINITNNVISLDTTLLDSVVRVQNIYVKNDENTTLLKGEAVYVTGANGTNILVKRASNVAESSSSKTLGLTMTSIPSKGFGYVVKEGLLAGLNTNSADSAGVPIWLGVNGALIYGLNNKPYAPNHLVYLGVVTRKNPNVGEVYVTVQNGFEIKELHDVQIIDPVNKASLYYNSSQSLWRDTTAALLVSDTVSMLSKYVNTYSNQTGINGDKTFNNVITIDSATVTGKLLVNTNISDAVKISSNTNSTNLELANNSGNSVFIKSSNRNMTLQTDTIALMYLNGETNRVGILTMSPEQALEVAGTIRIDSLGSNTLIPTKLVGANNANDLSDVKLGTGLFISNDTLKLNDNIINLGDTATLLRDDYYSITTNKLVWTEGNKKLIPYFTQVYRNGQLLKLIEQYLFSGINNDTITLQAGNYKLGDNITVIAIDNIVALAGSGGMITLQGDVTGSGTSSITTTIGVNKVTNTMLAGSISDSKLNTITTVGKVSNSATTATDVNTANHIVLRDASGNFSAGTITASLNGNANTSTTLATGRTIGITGDLTYTSPSFNGSANVTAVGTLANSGVTANTYTAATVTVDAKGRITSASNNTIPTVNDGILTMAVSGNGLTGSQTFTANQSSAATFTVTSNATSNNTANTIVYRDANRDFIARNITASNFYGNATTAGVANNLLSVTGGPSALVNFSINTASLNGVRTVTIPDNNVTMATTNLSQTFGGTQTFSGTASFTGSVTGLTSSVVGLGNVTNESKATMFTSPTFTGTVVLPSTTSIGTVTNTEIGYVDGVTSAIQTQLNAKQNTLTNPVTGTGTNNYIPKFTTTGSTIGNSTLIDNGTTISTSSILSTTNYAALDAGNNTHRLTNTLSGNQTWNTPYGFITSYSGNWYFNIDIDGSTSTDFPILSVLSNSITKKSGIALNSQLTANGTYTPAITFSSLSNSGAYYSTYAAIIGKKTGTGGQFGDSGNYNSGHIEFYGTAQVGQALGGVMLTPPNMVVGVGVGIGYDAPPTIKGRLIVSEKLGINQSTPAFALDVSGTANITGATTLGSTLTVTGATTLNNILTINSGANTNSLSINNTGASNILSMYSTNNSSFTRSEYKNGLTGNTTSDGLNVGYFDGGYFVNYENTKSYLYTNNNTNQLVLDTDGNVGVGIADATDKLDVNGTLRVRTTNTVASTALLGRDNNGVIGGVIIGSGLTLSNSTLSLSASSGGFITTNSNYTVTITDTWIVFNNNFNNIIVTLPDASTSLGRTLYFRNVAAGSIVSAGTANIIDNTITTGTPNNNILGAGNTNVKWCTLVSNGQYWIKMQAGSL